MPSTLTPSTANVRSLELEITGTCQLQCTTCYADSGPSGTHGTMTADDWRRVINEAEELGVERVQFIGGEPTLHPALPGLVRHAVDRGLAVEVFSNLVHIRPAVWAVLALPGVNLATSWYSDRADEHERITQGRDSWARTRANIAEAVRRGIQIRAGIIHVFDGQRVEQAEAELRGLGVTEILVDRMRGVGRGAAGREPQVSELCGRCTKGRGAILPNGDVAGCVMSRFLPAGNVRSQRLRDILTGPAWADIVKAVPAVQGGACPPDDGSDCSPANTPACLPSYGVPE